MNAYQLAAGMFSPDHADKNASETMKCYTKMMSDAGILTTKSKRKCKELISEQEKLEEEAEVELLAKMLSSINNSSTSDDICGDGDQSPLKGREALKLRHQWASGMDFYESSLSDFFTACFVGDKPYVEKMLIKAQDKYKLMEKRETLMRFNALVCVVQGARLSDNKSADNNVDRMGTLQLLIKEGANIHAKDVAGYSVIFHCFTVSANLTETRKLGIELMRVGADPNMQNRFGCTPLHENFFEENYENLEILVEHGADPSIEDNDGSSPMTLMSLIPPRFHQIFRKAASIETNKKRQQAISNICSYCRQSGSTKLKLCENCCEAQYCDKKCQTLHWKSHRKGCKEKGKGKVEVKQLGEEKLFYSIINYQNITIRKSNRNTDHHKKRSVFKVKVQVEPTLDTSKSPLTVYNKSRTFKAEIEPNHKRYEKIVQKIRDEGILKTKGFFYASVEENDEFKLQIENILPPEKW